MTEQEKIDCWSIEEATERIRAYARKRRGELELAYTKHAKQRMKERNIIVSDATYVLAHGWIDDEPEPSTREGYCKYKICGRSPNSGSKEICLVVIPDPHKPAIKIVTVMWKDLG